MVMLHIKLKGMTHAVTWLQIFYLTLGVKTQRFQNLLMVHIKLKEITNETLSHLATLLSSLIAHEWVGLQTL